MSQNDNSLEFNTDFFDLVAVFTYDKIDFNLLFPYKFQINALSKEKINRLLLLDFKTPLKAFVWGIVPAFLFFGLSLDRFYKGDKILGVVKFLLWFCSTPLLIVCGFFGLNLEINHDFAGFYMITLSLLFVWNLVDFFLVWQGIKKDNLKKLVNFLEQN